MMQVAVFGATGGIGRQVVSQLLSASHRVKAIVRRSGALDIRNAGLDIVTVPDLSSGPSVEAAVAGCDAVISAVGPRSLNDGPVASTATRAILAAMEATGVRRLVVVSATPVGPVPPDEGLLIRWVLLPLISFILRSLYLDLANMEAYVKQSAVEWTIVRPPRLSNKPFGGRYRSRIGGNVPRGYIISRADVAHAMCSALSNPETIREAVGVAD